VVAVHYLAFFPDKLAWKLRTNAVCWLLSGVPGDSILKFDFAREILLVIEKPADTMLPTGLAFGLDGQS
jgi:hypothetical protein